MVTQKRSLWVLPVIALLLVSACGENDDAPEAVLLVTVDTLGARHIGCYGAAENETPAVDRLASRGVRFTTAVCQSSWTLPSLASLMTSRYPGQIGLKKGRNRLPGSIPLLSTLMKKAGYRTAALVTNPYLAPAFGFSRDFDDYVMLPPESLTEDRPRKIPRGRFSLVADAGVVTDTALQWLERHGEEKYFLWVHYMDPHIPYASLREDRADLSDPVREEVLAFLRDPVMIHRQCGRSELSEEAKKAIRRCYWADITFFDRQFGRLLDGVRDQLESGNLLLVFTSDHGEEFWEHGCFEHGHTLYDELLTVPLIIARPGFLPLNRVMDTQAGLIDVVPTLLQLCGITPPADTAGRSLLPLGNGRGSGRALISEGILWGGDLKSMRTKKYKVVYDPEAQTGVAFDLSIDPAERVPLNPGDHPRTARLLDDLIERVKSHEKDVPADALKDAGSDDPLREDTETWRRLKALGYIPEDREPDGASEKENDLDRGGDADQEDELPDP
jgi:arylsulfatase A-like enzyme